MPVVIPPWLQTRPADFLAAARGGAEVGAQLHGQDLEHAARMAAISQQAAEAGMRAREASERLAVEREAAQSRMALLTQAAANRYQQQQMRQRAIEGGMSPVEAWLQFPGSQGEQPGPGEFAAYNNQQRASAPLETVADPNNPGKAAGFRIGSRFYPMPRAAAGAGADKFTPREAAAIKILSDTAKSARGILSKNVPGDPRNRMAMSDLRNSEGVLKKFGVDLSGPTAAPGATAPGQAAGAPGAAPAQPGLPQQGQVVNGHRYMGGPAWQQSSWQPVNPEGDSFIGTPGQPNQAALPGGMQDNQPVPDESEDVPTDEEQ